MKVVVVDVSGGKVWRFLARLESGRGEGKSGHRDYRQHAYYNNRYYDVPLPVVLDPSWAEFMLLLFQLEQSPSNYSQRNIRALTLTE